MSGKRLLSLVANSKEATNLSTKLHKCRELDIDWTLVPDNFKKVGCCGKWLIKIILVYL